jgi:nucleotide-binding universal stress UspA family protein
MAELFQIPPTDAVLPVACPVSGFLGFELGGGPAGDLVRSLLACRVRRWSRWTDLRNRLAAGACGDLVVSGEAWRRHGAELWPRQSARRILVVRQPRAAYREVLIAAESAADARALIARMRTPFHASSRPVQLIHSVQPSTWLLMAEALGAAAGPWMCAEDFAAQVAADAVPLGAARTVIVPGPPALAVRNAVLEAPPDLLVLGWHRHRLRHPLLAHPTAWQLSRSVPVDVLLVDLTTGGQLPQEDPRSARQTPRD